VNLPKPRADSNCFAFRRYSALEEFLEALLQQALSIIASGIIRPGAFHVFGIEMSEPTSQLLFRHPARFRRLRPHANPAFGIVVFAGTPTAFIAARLSAKGAGVCAAA
jgi:hypothetical protein